MLLCFSALDPHGMSTFLREASLLSCDFLSVHVVQLQVARQHAGKFIHTCLLLAPLKQGTPWGPAKGSVKNIRGTGAAAVAWHPHLFLLAIAWQDGALSVWDASRRHLEEDSKVHRHPVSHLVWDPAGNSLLTADSQGKVCGAPAVPQPAGNTISVGDWVHV